MRNIYVLKFITRIISHKYEINQFPYMSCINANFIQLLFNHHRIIIKGNCSLSGIIFFLSIVHLSIFKFDLYTDFSFRIVGFLYIRNYAISNNFACRISCHITRQLRVENGINHAGVFEFIITLLTALHVNSGNAGNPRQFSDTPARGTDTWSLRVHVRETDRVFPTTNDICSIV